jgi:hypothetical protein
MRRGEAACWSNDPEPRRKFFEVVKLDVQLCEALPLA